MASQPRHAQTQKTSLFQRWLNHNRAYGETIERYAHPAKKH